MVKLQWIITIFHGRELENSIPSLSLPFSDSRTHARIYAHTPCMYICKGSCVCGT